MNLIATLVFVCGLLIYGIARGGEYALREFSRRGKIRVLWVDPDTKHATVSFERVEGNEIVRGKGANKRRYVLDGEAVYGGGKYRTTVLHIRRGWNYTLHKDADGNAVDGPVRFPTDAETVGKGGLKAALAAFDPLTYYKATSINGYAAALNANDPGPEKTSPLMIIAICLLILGLATLGTLVWIGGKVADGTAKVPGVSG